MAETTDAFRAARNLIERFGENAVSEAEERIRELENEGQREAALFWKKVLDQLRMLVEQGDGGSGH